MPSQTVPARRDIPVEQTWDAASVFPDDAAWAAEIAAVEAALPSFAAFQARLLDGATPSVLLECFAAVEDLLTRTYRVYVYAGMFYNVDTADQDALAKHDRAGGLFARAAATVAFLDPALLTIGFETLRRWVADDPRLRIYAHYVDSLERQQAHIRSAEVEELLAMAREPFGTANQTHTILADAELRFAPAHTVGGESLRDRPGHHRCPACLPRPRGAPHRLGELRRRASGPQEHHGHLPCRRRQAATSSSRARAAIASSLEAASLPNHIPSRGLPQPDRHLQQHLPTWHRYWEVRRRALGLDAAACLRHAGAAHRQTQPVSPSRRRWTGSPRAWPPLGDEYVQAMRRGVLEQRWVDIYPNKGKRAGAFSSGAPGTHPFILMSYNDDIFSMSTLAHELGHSMHSYYTWHTQPLVYARLRDLRGRGRLQLQPGAGARPPAARPTTIRDSRSR